MSRRPKTEEGRQRALSRHRATGALVALIALAVMAVAFAFTLRGRS